MKKLTRKMIPAFAMLLLSAVLMSTASFAWFSMNGAVTASGFEVKATAPAALWISTTDSNYGTEAKFTATSNLNNQALAASQGAMAPVTPKDNSSAKASAWAFQSLTEAAYKAVKEDGKVADDFEGTLYADDTKNFYKTSLWLLLEGQHDDAAVEKKIVNVACNVDIQKEDADPIWKSLRIALVTDGDDVTTAGSVIFQPQDDPEEGKTVVALSAQKLTTIAAQEHIQVYVYIWFEGEDDDCYNANAQHLDSYKIDFSFTTAAVSGS